MVQLIPFMCRCLEDIQLFDITAYWLLNHKHQRCTSTYGCSTTETFQTVKTKLSRVS